MSASIIVIPAYQPDKRLPELIERLRARGFERVIVVDDGSGHKQRVHVDACLDMGAQVVRHAVNQGKGRALKTGVNRAMLLWPGAGVVTADADGQHTLEDIEKLDAALTRFPTSMILGVRDISRMPLRSRAGNTITRFVHALCTGTDVRDTQTGLRAFPGALLPMLFGVHGERYEYEMAVLMDLPKKGAGIAEVPIQTIYLEENRSSHFDTVKDSAKVYASIYACKRRDIIIFALATLLSYLLYGPLPAWAALLVAQVAHLSLRTPRAQSPLTLLLALAVPPLLAYAGWFLLSWPPALCFVLANFISLAVYLLFFVKKPTEAS